MNNDLVQRLRAAAKAREIPSGAGIMFDPARDIISQLPGLLEHEAASLIESLSFLLAAKSTALLAAAEAHKESERQFREYVRQHMAKVPSDTAKASINDTHAVRCEAAAIAARTAAGG